MVDGPIGPKLVGALDAYLNFGPGTTGIGSGFRKTRPGSANPLGMSFAPRTNPRVQNPTHTRLLMGEKPTGSRVPIAIPNLS